MAIFRTSFSDAAVLNIFENLVDITQTVVKIVFNIQQNMTLKDNAEAPENFYNFLMKSW